MKSRIKAYKHLKNKRVCLGKIPNRDNAYLILFKILTDNPEPRVKCFHKKGKIMETGVVVSEEALLCIADYVVNEILESK